MPSALQGGLGALLERGDLLFGLFARDSIALLNLAIN
jgi:hypothetical protein